MIWDWFFRRLSWREIRDDLREMKRQQREVEAASKRLEARLREAFSDDEWAAVAERCERRLEQRIRGFPDLSVDMLSPSCDYDSGQSC